MAAKKPDVLKRIMLRCCRELTKFIYRITKKETILRFLENLPRFGVFCNSKQTIMRNEVIEIGKIIKKRRELLGLLQPQLASIAGVSRRTIQLVEMGKANPSFETLIKIADPLGLALKLLLKEPGTNKQIPL